MSSSHPTPRESVLKAQALVQARFPLAHDRREWVFLAEVNALLNDALQNGEVPGGVQPETGADADSAMA